MTIDKDKIHPVRFTKGQIGFLKHMINETAMGYWEEECEDIMSTIKEFEEDECLKLFNKED